MKSYRVIHFFLILLTPALLLAQFPKHEYIHHPSALQNQIEFFFMIPEGEGPFPILFLPVANHPKGAEILVDFGYFDRFINLGIACVAISASGFGGSNGKPDFSGPYSREAILAVINHFKDLSSIDGFRMGIYGVNRNAILASLVSANCPDLTLQILESGEYDLTSRRENLPGYLKALGLQQSLLKQTGNSDEALIDRSSLFHTNRMHQTTLILHGQYDDHYGLPSAGALYKKLIDQGTKSYFKFYRNGLHELPPEKWEEIIPFLREHFFGLTGIGMQVTQVGPVMQIMKIQSGMPAESSNRLKIGDTILAIFTQNDSFLMDTIKMPVKEFISYVVGEKGTTLRLKVQHFDSEIEEIVLKRAGYISSF